MNREQIKFEQVIKARRKRESRIRRMNQVVNPLKKKTEEKISWWQRFINWLKNIFS